MAGVIPLPDRIARLTMPGDELLADITNQTNAQSRDTGKARLREPVRDQVELRVVDLDGLLAMDHAARLIWDYVQKVDLLALWLYATSEGIGSARALARLCEVHEAYRWLCGGVSMNHHGLSDFRTAHPELLDRLLSESVASLSVAGVVSLDEVAQDGVRVRASAGASSFRRR